MTKSEFELFKSLINSLLVKVEGLLGKVDDVANKVDELGKVVQTDEGTGTWTDPFKNWQVGKPVKSGMWYKTYDGYLWEAKKDGYPSSSIDYEYFDVVGV